MIKSDVFFKEKPFFSKFLSFFLRKFKKREMMAARFVMNLSSPLLNYMIDISKYCIMNFYYFWSNYMHMYWMVLTTGPRSEFPLNIIH